MAGPPPAAPGSTAAIEIAFQGKHNAMFVSVIAGSSNQTGLMQGMKRVAQLRQPTSQTTAGCVTDPHVLDQFRRPDSALMQIDDRFGVALQLHAVETGGFVQQRSHTTPLAQQTQSLREPHLVIEFGEANHIAAAATAVAVEEIFVGIHQETRFVIFMQRAEP